MASNVSCLPIDLEVTPRNLLPFQEVVQHHHSDFITWNDEDRLPVG
jgi:hypothetical protein